MTAPVAKPTGDHARLYAAHGWRIFPIRPRTKRPLCRHGSTEATDNADQVADWWRRWPYANIGALVPGGVVVADLDPRNGCPLTPAELPETLTVATGGGGWHLYYRAPAGVALAAHSDVLAGVDLIAAGRPSSRATPTVSPPTTGTDSGARSNPPKSKRSSRPPPAHRGNRT